MSRELFGTDGVRALAGQYPLDDIGTVAIGRAVGTQFARDKEHIVIACDTRESSTHLVQMITQGLQAVGVNAVFAGVLPTPGLAYITAQHDEFVAGIMITASHNPYEFNGVKVFSASGSKLPDDAEERLNHDIEAGVPNRSPGSFATRDLAHEYEDFLVSSARGLKLDVYKIAVDTANGAASALGQRVFEQLGAEVIALGNEPNGRNINVRCGATDTTELQRVVREQHCDLGIAVDGDADRLILVDAAGRACNGDYLMYMLAVANGYKHVVATVMSNLGTEQALKTKGISMERTAVGDRYVLERLLATGYKLGGEQSGHIILPDFATTGDGLLAAVQVLSAINSSGKSLSEWRDEVSMLPQSLVNFPIADKTKLNSPEVEDYVRVKTAELGNSGRILVRPSGTEPLARVMVEAPNAEALATEMANHIQELVL
ncbi:phosphoglucosamine mutase [Candidatus Saccharibacteria bacterium]|nr:MAG: phosphoglucosamine mutase [Candidatus Saccharibacteria bacterium]